MRGLTAQTSAEGDAEFCILLSVIDETFHKPCTRVRATGWMSWCGTRSSKTCSKS